MAFQEQTKSVTYQKAAVMLELQIPTTGTYDDTLYDIKNQSFGLTCHFQRTYIFAVYLFKKNVKLNKWVLETSSTSYIWPLNIGYIFSPHPWLFTAVAPQLYWAANSLIPTVDSFA